jgi:ABC-2 type transport system permease protein
VIAGLLAQREYMRCELLRTLRNRRYFIFAIAFPIALYFMIAGPNRGQNDIGGSGIPATLYFMVSVSSFGTMTAMLSTGARIAAERSTGWNRQLRISPLTPREYFRAKVLTAYLVAIVSILLLYVSGISLGVSLPAARWLGMFVHVLIGLIPFAALGILLGHLLAVDSMGPVMGGLTAVLALLSGTWFPVPGHGVVHVIAVELPSYYLVQAGRIGIGGQAWGTHGWIVLVGWTVVLTALARRAYVRDTSRA